MLFNLFKVSLLLAIVFSAVAFFGTEHMAGVHKDNIREVYAFAGREYVEDEPNPISIQYDNPIQTYLASKFHLTGPMINSALITKENLADAGLGENCGSIEYLHILRDDMDQTVFKDSWLCCAPNLASPFTPIIYDEREDRVLAMCGMADDAHVIAMSANDYNQLLSVFIGDAQDRAIFDVRNAHKTD